MSESKPQRQVILGAAGGLLVVGVLVALFGSLAFGIVLVVIALVLPLFFR